MCVGGICDLESCVFSGKFIGFASLSFCLSLLGQLAHLPFPSKTGNSTMMQLVCCIVYASLLWGTTAKQADVELATKEMQAFFAIFANNTAPYPAASYSTAAFQKTYDLFKKGQSSADGVWPYILTVRDDKLTSSYHTGYLLKQLFDGKVPAHRVLDKSHLMVYLSHDKLPLQSDVDRLIKIERVLPSKPLHALPIGTRIGVGLFDQIFNAPAKPNRNAKLLVTLRDSSTYNAFEAKTRSDIFSFNQVFSMRVFGQDLGKADALFKDAFSDTAPSKRFVTAFCFLFICFSFGRVRR